MMLRNNKLLFIGLALSILFVVINLMTLDWYPLPWVDEVGTADTPINVALYGKWFTTAWNYSYNPLYAFLLIPWVLVFGVSHSAVTSLNILIAFLLCLTLLRYLINSRKITTIWSLIIFIIMFWGANVLAWNFRSGRIDVLIMLFTFLVVGVILKFETFQRKDYSRLFLFSLLLFLSGVISIPVVLFLLLILFISQRNHRRVVFKQTLIFTMACLLGFFLVSLFYWFHNYLLHYWATFIDFNETIVGTKSFFHRTIDAYKLNSEALILSLLNISIIVLLFFRKRVALNSLNVIFLFSCLLVPLIMTLAGRYQVYYSWLFYIPTFILTITLFDSSSIFIKTIIGLVTIFIFVTGFPNSLFQGDRDSITRIDQFIKNQPITSSSIVISDHLSYYPIKNITQRCYFPGSNNSIWTDMPDYSIIPSKNYGKFQFLYEALYEQIQFEKKNIVVDSIDFIIKSPVSYGSESLTDFFIKQKSLGKTVTAIDSLNNPKIIVYQVK